MILRREQGKLCLRYYNTENRAEKRRKSDILDFFTIIYIIYISGSRLKQRNNTHDNFAEAGEMTFSVLMSVYKKDDPGFFRIALRSIYEDQTRKPDEIVLVFDGPVTDELNEAADEFAADKKDVVKFVKYDVNKGLGEALRIGSGYCTCDYICRMDSDDISRSDRFELQMKYVEEHPEIDVLGANIAEFDKSPDEDDLKIRVCPEKHEDIVKRCKSRNPMNHGTVCMKRTSLEKCGGYETLLLLEDYLLWAKMIVAGCRLENMQEALLYFRVGNGFIGRRNSKVRIKGWKDMQNYMLKNGLITRPRAWINMIAIRLFIYTPSGLKKFLYTKILRKKA